MLTESRRCLRRDAVTIRRATVPIHCSTDAYGTTPYPYGETPYRYIGPPYPYRKTRYRGDVFRSPLRARHRALWFLASALKGRQHRA
jgi:hypothetical protein